MNRTDMSETTPEKFGWLAFDKSTRTHHKMLLSFAKVLSTFSFFSIFACATLGIEGESQNKKATIFYILVYQNRR
jgi:hypothetical protein